MKAVIHIALLQFVFFCNNLNVQAQRRPGDLADIKVWDVMKGKYTAIEGDFSKNLVIVFLSPECPLCQNYTLQIKDVQMRFADDVLVYVVFPGRAYSDQELLQFRESYELSMPFYQDRDFALSKHFGIKVTPEVVLTNIHGKKLYIGAIDNWAADLGKKRKNITMHYLTDAIQQTLSNRTILIPQTEAVGCLINDR